MCIKIMLNKVADVQKFVHKANKYNNNLQIRSGKSVVNASSLMGILSLDLEKPVNLYWNDNNITESVRKDFSEWKC